MPVKKPANAVKNAEVKAPPKANPAKAEEPKVQEKKADAPNSAEQKKEALAEKPKAPAKRSLSKRAPK